MRLFIALCALCLSAAVPSARAARPTEPALTLGLQTCLANGVDAGIRALYSDRPDLGAEMSAKVATESAKLGALIDTEVIASQSVSKRVTRYYVALYFSRAPLWLRIERYDNQEKSFFLPLKCSVNPDEILPGYVTEFYH